MKDSLLVGLHPYKCNLLAPAHDESAFKGIFRGLYSVSKNVYRRPLFDNAGKESKLCIINSWCLAVLATSS